MGEGHTDWKSIVIVLVAFFALAGVGLLAVIRYVPTEPAQVASADTLSPPAASAPQDICARFAMPRKTILDVLARKDLDKNEFETTADYTKRIANTLEPLKTVTVATKLHENFSDYDADHKSLTVGVTFAFNYFFLRMQTKPVYMSLVLDRTETAGQSYSAHNAFGATADIDVTSVSQRVLLIEQRSINSSALSSVKQPKVKVDIADAKALKSNLCLVVTGTPKAPFKVDDTDNKRATITDPHEVQTQTIGLIIQPRTGDVIDARSGTVITHFDAAAIEAYSSAIH